MSKKFSLILCSFAWTLPVSAQDQKPLTPIPPGNFQFEGNWDCAGAMGYDPQQKRLVEFDANNSGAATYS
ncbi:MAG TPA: hypothetical protein VN924_26940 [Bryobacteraceae bacterium]|nr:hypothetical protein [Bryobacteraceae bacterium]